MRTTSFLQTETIITALEFALSKGAFGDNAKQKKAARELLKEMKGSKTPSGRLQQLKTTLRNGSSIDGMIKATGTSRRTVFRYLNHFEEAGLDIVIVDGKYKLK